MGPTIKRVTGLAALCALFVFAGTANASDLLLVHGHIYTAAANGGKWAEAIAMVCVALPIFWT